MNERIKELAEQAGLYIAYDNRAVTDKELERFAELVAEDAVAKERERVKQENQRGYVERGEQA